MQKQMFGCNVPTKLGAAGPSGEHRGGEIDGWIMGTGVCSSPLPCRLGAWGARFRAEPPWTIGCIVKLDGLHRSSLSRLTYLPDCTCSVAIKYENNEK